MGDRRQTGEEQTVAEDITRADDSGFADPPPGSEDDLKLSGYRVVRKLGSGGMGQVFLAHQFEPVSRDVAIKLIQSKLLSPASEVRFMVERQALAQMHHPAIAQIHDAGTNPDGFPYFVMEYVPGQPLTRFCNEERLSLRERLELFIRICHGVSHAHQKGIIHRDLKPGNILVSRIDGTPHPKIIDFGIAATAISAGERRAQIEAGTPVYMSPELFDRGRGIDTRADVYSLGIILCELLTDRRPYDSNLFDHTDTRVILQRLSAHPPQRPSHLLQHDPPTLASLASRRRTSGRRLVRSLAGDLDAIALKAIAHNGDERYANVSELADDVQRYLLRQPVLARAGGKLYQSRRFVERNALAMTAAGLIALSMATGLAMAIQGLNEARKQQQIAETRSLELERVVAFQQTMLGGLEPRQLGDGFVQRLRRQYAQSFAHGTQADTIEAGVEAFDVAVGQINPTDLAQDLIDEFMVQRAIDSIESDFADQPHLQASLYETVRDIYINAGMVDNSLPLAQRVVDLRVESLGPGATSTLHARQQLYRLLSRVGQFDAARAELDEIQARMDTSNLAQLKLKHDTWDSMANLLVNTGQNEQALAMAEQNLELAERELGLHHADTVRAVNTVGYVHALSGRIETALDYFRLSADRARGHFEPHEDAYYSAMLNVGAALSYLDRLEEAHEVELEVYGILANHHGRRHDSTLRVMNNMAVTLMGMERFDEATAMMQDILRLTQEAWGPQSPITLGSMHNLADLYLRTGQAQLALDQIEPVITWRERLLGAEHADTLRARYFAAQANLAMDRHPQAREQIDQVIERRSRTLDADDPRLLSALMLAADIDQKAGQTQTEVLLRQQVFDHLGTREQSPEASHLASAVRLLELRRLAGENARADDLAEHIAVHFQADRQDLEEIRLRFEQVMRAPGPAR